MNRREKMASKQALLLWSQRIGTFLHALARKKFFAPLPFRSFPPMEDLEFAKDEPPISKFTTKLLLLIPRLKRETWKLHLPVTEINIHVNLRHFGGKILVFSFYLDDLTMRNCLQAHWWGSFLSLIGTQQRQHQYINNTQPSTCIWVFKPSKDQTLPMSWYS